MANMTDDQLIELTQQNMKAVADMKTKRANTASAAGLTCYKQYYDKYVPTFVNTIFGPEAEAKRLSTAANNKTRSQAIRLIAEMIQVVRCDEEYKAMDGHFDQLVRSANCSLFDKMTLPLSDLFIFRPKLEAIEIALKAGSIGEVVMSNNVLSDLFRDVSLGL